MSLFVLPLTNAPQTFDVIIVGVNYRLSLVWNDQADSGWQFDLSNADTLEVLVAGVPLITGASLLAGLDYLGFVGNLYAYTSGDITAVPTYDNLGVNSNIYLRTVG